MHRSEAINDFMLVGLRSSHSFSFTRVLEAKYPKKKRTSNRSILLVEWINSSVIFNFHDILLLDAFRLQRRQQHTRFEESRVQTSTNSSIFETLCFFGRLNTTHLFDSHQVPGEVHECLTILRTRDQLENESTTQRIQHKKKWIPTINQWWKAKIMVVLAFSKRTLTQGVY